jgi:uncharacterized integral membrane protein
MKRNHTFSFWGFVISALVLVLFAVQNAQEVGFKFFVWKTHLSLSVLLIVAFLIGLIAGAIFSFRKNRFEDNGSNTEKLKSNQDKWTPSVHNTKIDKDKEDH